MRLYRRIMSIQTLSRGTCYGIIVVKQFSLLKLLELCKKYMLLHDILLADLCSQEF